VAVGGPFVSRALGLFITVAVECFLNADYLHIAVTVWHTSESRIPVYYNWCWGPLKEEYLPITVAFGDHFESRAGYLYIAVAVGRAFKSRAAEYLHHAVAVGGPFENRILAHCRTLLLRSYLKAEHLHITVTVGQPFKSSVLTHCSCYWGPFENRLLAHCSCC